MPDNLKIIEMSLPVGDGDFHLILFSFPEKLFIGYKADALSVPESLKTLALEDLQALHEIVCGFKSKDLNLAPEDFPRFKALHCFTVDRQKPSKPDYSKIGDLIRTIMNYYFPKSARASAPFAGHKELVKFAESAPAIVTFYNSIPRLHDFHTRPA